jgi:hypothetical protein
MADLPAGPEAVAVVAAVVAPDGPVGGHGQIGIPIFTIFHPCIPGGHLAGQTLLPISEEQELQDPEIQNQL